jgi:hypothetical protein
MNHNEFLSFNETAALIAAVGHDVTVVVEGENGIGKTALFHALRAMPQFAGFIAVDPIDCTQLSDGSVWMPDIDKEKGVSRELPNERFGVNKDNRLGVNGSKPVLIFLDEIAKAPQYIKNAIAPIVYERRVGEYHLPEGSVVFCATNLAVEGLGDAIQPHLRNRITFVKMRKPKADEWINQYAIPKKLSAEVIAFVHNYPHVMDSFLDYEKGGTHEGKDLSKDNGMIFNPRLQQLAYASPRSLDRASKIVINGEQVSLKDNVVEAALIGSLGHVTAENLSSFIRFGKDICSYERVQQDPENAPISPNATAQLVQVMQFVTRTDTREQADKVSRYVTRMQAEMQSIFCNTVASSTKVGIFVNVKPFTEMLAAHRIFFTTTK